jgi:transposase
MLALLLGIEHEKVAALYGVSDLTLRRWILAFNRRGIDGLIDRPKPGRRRKISREKAADLCAVLDDPKRVGQVHWTGKKFHGYLRSDLSLEVGYSTVIRFLHEQNYRLKVPQPWPDRQNEAERQAFVETLQALQQDPDVEIWFGDESGFEGDPRPRRRWAKKGEKARVTKNGDHLRMNVTAIIAPRTGHGYALEFSHSDTEIFQAFLDHANRDLAFERKRQILILDNASWHKNQQLRWGRFEPLFLPAYSPDFNPIERLWLIIKAEWFTDFIAKTRPDLIARLDQALCWALNRKEENQKTCAIRSNL